LYINKKRILDLELDLHIYDKVKYITTKIKQDRPIKRASSYLKLIPTNSLRTRV